MVMGYNKHKQPTPLLPGCFSHQMDYYFDRDELLYEMAEEFRIQQKREQEEEEDEFYTHPSLTDYERNPNLR